MNHTGATVVELRSPLHQRAFRFIKALFTAILLSLVIAVGWYGVCLLFWQKPPASAFSGLPVVMLVFIIVMMWVFDRYEPFRIILTEHDLWIGGRFSGRRTRYENIRLLQQEVPENSVGNVREIVIERHRGRPLKIWFSAHDAERCFKALREICDHAPAIDRDKLHAPANPEHEAAGAEILTAELQRRKRMALLGGTVALLIGLAILANLILHNGSVHRWIACAAFLFGGGTALWSYLRVSSLRNSSDEELDQNDA